MSRWQILNTTKKYQQPQNPKDFSEEEFVHILLKNRGIEKEEEISDFLYPNLEKISLEKAGVNLNQAKKASERIIAALKNKESIIVYSDYDVDGVCGAAIIWEMLYSLGANVMPYIPDREKEGYGLSRHGIDLVKKKFSADLIIAVDQGVANSDQIKYAKTKTIDTIVIDHHLLQEDLSFATAVVHTTCLSAGGLAWLFARYFSKTYSASIKSDSNLPSKIDGFLGLGALSTIADLVPLTGWNRAIATSGLNKLKLSDRTGLHALIKVSGLRKSDLNYVDISHRLAPRLNSMGRLYHAIDSLRLMCTCDKDHAFSLAKKIDRVNKERRSLSKDAVSLAIEKIKKSIMIGDYSTNIYKKMIFVSDSQFHQGVISLVAGRLADRYNRPAIVVTKGPEISKASVRSIKGFDIMKIMNKVKSLFIDMGGHPQAAGFTVKTKTIKKLKEKLASLIDNELNEKFLEKTLDIDMFLDISRVNSDLYNILLPLQPFGMANPEPIFASHNVKIKSIRQIGSDKSHLKIVFDNGSRDGLDAVGFGFGSLYHKISPQKNLSIAYTVGKNNFRGREKLQLIIKDVKIAT